ncbi:MAG: PilN domain-containing protein [Lachnospiraceae bacterium]|nr:PilN domain-containing protein [Lachnospiraceae bacterium]
MARIYLGGAGTNVKGLKELIENEFNGIEVVILPKLPGINISKDNRVAEEHSTELIACIGASFPTISFYRKSEKEALSKTLIISAVGLVLVAVAAVFIVLNGKTEYDKAMERKGTLVAQRDALEAKGIEMLEDGYNAAAARFARIEEADAGTFNHNENWNDILKSLELESVSSMTVSSVTSNETGLTMNVTVGSKEDAAKLLMQLQNIPYFEEVTISSISENTSDEMGIKIVSFSLQCKYKLPDTDAETGKEE